METLKSTVFSKFKVREIQLLSLVFFINKNKKMGRLLQINTGEGKSIIVQMMAAFHALQEKKVDIITSNNSLAERDAEDSRKYFEQLGLTVGFIHEDIEKEDFEKDIVYGTSHNFCLGFLNMYLGEEKARRIERKQDFLIVDEVDSMLIDKPDITTYISKTSIFKDKIKIYWDLIWIMFNEMKNGLNMQIQRIEDYDKSIKKDLLSLIKKKMGEETSQNFRELIRMKKEVWVDNLLQASMMLINENYVISENKVQIVDLDTGETQKSMQWADGLHYFIEQKHGIFNNSITSTFLYENHMNYIKRYGENIIGMTGTLGTITYQEFLNEIYNVDLFILPPYSKNRLQLLSPIVCSDKNSHHKKILKEIKKKLKEKRPVLILFETILDARDFTKILDSKNLKYKEYLESHKKRDSDEFVLKKDSIILATNLGGRGTDFKVDHDLSQNGGLHVIISFIPSNFRVRRQAFGRAARKGQNGSGQMVVNQLKTHFLSKMVI